MLKIIKNICLPVVLLGSACLGMGPSIFFAHDSQLSDPSTNSNIPKISLTVECDNARTAYGVFSPSVISTPQEYKAHIDAMVRDYKLDVSMYMTGTIMQEKEVLANAYAGMKLESYKISSGNPLIEKIFQDARDANFFSIEQAIDYVIKQLPAKYQDKCSRDIFSLRGLEIQMDACAQKMDYCDTLIRAHEQKMIAETQAQMKALSAYDIVSKEIPRLQAMMKQLESSIVKGVSEAQHLKKQSKDLALKKIAQLKSDLRDVKIRLNCINQHIIQVGLQACKDAKQLQQFFIALRDNGLLSEFDQKTLDAIHLGLFDKGAFRYEAHGTLTQVVKDFLVNAGIAPKEFEKMVAANSLQKHLYEDLGNKINDIAALSVIHIDDANVILCTDAFVSAIPATVDMIKTGTASEAVVATKLAGALSKAAHAVAQPKQEVDASSSSSSSATVKNMYSEVRTDVSIAYGICADIAQEKGHLAIEKIKDVWNNEDVKLAVVAFCLFQPEIGLAVGVLASIPEMLSVGAVSATEAGVSGAVAASSLVAEVAAWESSVAGRTSFVPAGGGNAIKEFTSKIIQTSWKHVFSDDHLFHDILKLGNDKPEIINKFIDIIQGADSKNVLLKEGLTRIETVINSINTTVAVYIRAGKVVNINGFVGHSNRVLVGTVKMLDYFQK